MTPSFTQVVFPLIIYALDIKDRLDKGTSPAPDFEATQRELLTRLRSEIEARRQPDYGGDGSVFLGARYALTCWLDEIFIAHSSWSGVWNDRKLEVALYGTNERAWKFWDQVDVVLRKPTAARALTTPGLDAVEAVFLCIVLGFRGKYLENPSKLREYLDEMRPQITRGEAWQPPADRGVKTNVEPLAGRAALRKTIGFYGSLSVAGTFLILFVYLLAR